MFSTMPVIRWLCVLVVFCGGLWGTSAQAGFVQRAAQRMQANSQKRDTIHAMDILDRPFRLGHFYGNNVRRLYHAGVIEHSPLDGHPEH